MPPSEEAVEHALRVENLAPPPAIARPRFEARLHLARQMQHDFAASRPGTGPDGHLTAYERAARLMSPSAASAFDLNEEPAALRDAYGRSLFGQGCLLARRLVERGASFVEVALGGDSSVNWDTHVNNFETLPGLSHVLDGGWATLMNDLAARGLLDQTLIVWMGEFGRTPKINGSGGRDHFPDAWTAVLAGGGIRGGQVVGRTSDGGDGVEDRPLTVPDLLATICCALGIDPTEQNDSNTGRPILTVDKSARPIAEVLG
jgi:Protein of unknown function (DUF1501)